MNIRAQIELGPFIVSFSATYWQTNQKYSLYATRMEFIAKCNR